MDIWTGADITFNVVLLLLSLLVLLNQLQFLKVAARVILKIATVSIRAILKITTMLAITILYNINPLLDGQSWKARWIKSTGLFCMGCWCLKVYVEMKRATLRTALLDPRRRNNNKNWFFVEKLLEVGIPLVLVYYCTLAGFLSWSFIPTHEE